MYVNKCVKCGREFETKNPKRVICPDCLYPDKKMMINPSPDAGSSTDSTAQASSSEQQQPLNGYSTETQPQFYSSYSAGEGRPRPQRQYNNQGYNRPQGGYSRQNNYSNRGGTAKIDLKEIIDAIMVVDIAEEVITTKDLNKVDIIDKALITEDLNRVGLIKVDSKDRKEAKHLSNY